HELRLLRIIECAHTGRVPGNADADLVVGAADVVEPPAVVLRALVAQERLECRGSRHCPERGAILGSDIVEPVGEPHAASTFHVLWEDGRIAWNVLAKMAGDHACVKVVAAADADIDVNLDGFA